MSGDSAIFSFQMKYIRDLKENESVVSFSSIRSKQVKSKRNGEPYLELVLADRTGEIAAKVWDDVDVLREELQAGDFIKYKGRVQIYNGSRQLIVERIRKVTPGDQAQGFAESEVIRTTEYDIDEMWDRLHSLITENCRRPCILQLLRSVLENNREKIRSFPAGTEIHHNYWGGFLEHVLSVLESALFFASKYPSLDRDLLVAGAVLHDIGKLEELGNPKNPTYTTKGILIGHVVLGRDILLEEARKIPDFPADLLVHLEHLILSHQGQLEWGSPKQPKTAEALVLHYIDDLDAKMNRVLRLLKEDQNDSDFTSFDRFLRRPVFKGSYTGDSDPPADTGWPLRLVAGTRDTRE
ncbi:MAG TPA: HD domain-containing protein [Acidobacteriota bacterium]|nr:HD domain-containing protein [Acidobacteriota bacterium]